MKNLKLLSTIIIMLICNTIIAQELPEFGNRIDMGMIQSSELVEASGIVKSRKNAHVLWSHNDRNHQNRLFAINTQGKHLGVYRIDGIENRDWEDIAIGPGPVADLDYIYIGEVGDNYSEYDLKYIYRFPEPEVDFHQEPIETTIFNAEKIIFQYPDGNRDSETIMIDPLTKDLYVVSKREFEDIRVYRAPYPQSTTEVITLEHMTTLNLWQIVGGDISPSGLEILMKTYTNMYYWKRKPGQDLWQALDNEPATLPYIEEMQGEAVCWASDSMGYYTVSEENLGIPVHLFFYPRLNPSAVVFNEIMQDPSIVEDEQGEWFEIYNNSTESVDLNGWIIKDMDTDFHVISQSLILSPGNYLVFSNNSDPNTNGGVNVDYQYDSVVLDNYNDELLIVSSSGALIDSVVYDNSITFPNQEGASMTLLDPNMDNSVGLNWRKGTTPYGDGDLGNPGLPNSAAIPLVAIKDIQYTTEPSGISPLLDQRVTISGTLSTEPFGSFFKGYFFVQESIGMWSGILVKHLTDVAEGDSVILTGTVADNHGGVTTLIDVSGFKILKKSVFGIDPIIVTTGEIGTGGENAEAYEGVLIKATGTCDNDNQGWREWSIDDGTGSVKIYHRFLDDFTPDIGHTYKIKGIQYYSYRNNSYKILVLNEGDIVENPQGVENISKIPTDFKLYQNHPNPFNPETTIQFSIPKRSRVELTIYNVLGQKIRNLICQNYPVGEHTVKWDGRDDSGKIVNSSLYLLKISAGDFADIRKMTFMK